MGELNSRVIRWLNKVLTINYTVSVSSPGARRARRSGSARSRSPFSNKTGTMQIGNGRRTTGVLCAPEHSVLAQQRP
eukprot:2718252-Pyramimonas_sp.AAC.1